MFTKERKCLFCAILFGVSVGVGVGLICAFAVLYEAGVIQ